MPPAPMNPEFSPALLSRIEDAGLNASAPPQQLWLDGWIVRFSPGQAKRARCINAVAGGRTSFADHMAACTRIYAAAALPLIVRVTPFSLPAGLDESLAAEGLQSFDDTRVMVMSGLALPPPSLPEGVIIESVGLEPFAHRVGGFRGSPLAQRQAHAQRLRESPVEFFPFELRRAGTPVACGQFALEGDLVGLYDIYTAESARGRGLASLLCKHLLAQATSRGAKCAYLQVEGNNRSARAVYHRLGFSDGYAYHYRALNPNLA